MLERPGDVLTLSEHPDFALAVPTPDHFIPLLYVAGIAAAAGSHDEEPAVLIDGYAYGALSMTCITVGADALPLRATDGPGEPPGPDGVPPDQSNV